MDGRERGASGTISREGIAPHLYVDVLTTDSYSKLSMIPLKIIRC